MRKWTNESLELGAKKAVNMDTFKSFLGLEIIMALNQSNEIKVCLSTKPFRENQDVKDTMSYNQFNSIRTNQQFHPPSSDPCPLDPLWHCRIFFREFTRKAASVAVGVGCQALDESAILYTGRCRAKHYMPSKPVKYAIRFYSLTTSGKSLYLCSIHDNGKGYLGTAQPICEGLSHYADDTVETIFKRWDIEPDSSSALWVLQIGQQYQLHRAKRWMFTDNFYTHHTIAKKVS